MCLAWKCGSLIWVIQKRNYYSIQSENVVAECNSSREIVGNVSESWGRYFVWFAGEWKSVFFYYYNFWWVPPNNRSPIGIWTNHFRLVEYTHRLRDTSPYVMWGHGTAVFVTRSIETKTNRPTDPSVLKTRDECEYILFMFIDTGWFHVAGAVLLLLLLLRFFLLVGFGESDTLYLAWKRLIIFTRNICMQMNRPLIKWVRECVEC